MKRLIHALPLTFLVYLVGTLLALLPTASVIASVGSDPGLDPDGALFLERLRGALGGLTSTAWALVPLLALALLVSPLLQLAWLSALDGRPTVSAALQTAAARYGDALLVSVCAALPLVMVLAVLGGLPLAAHVLIDPSGDARNHDLWVAALALPGLALLALWSAWHDLCRAALVTAHDGVRRSLRTGLAALDLCSSGAWLRYTALGGAIGVTGYAAGAFLSGPGILRAGAVMLALQTLAFVRVAVRGLWLGVAVDRVRPTDLLTPGSESPAPPGA